MLVVGFAATTCAQTGREIAQKVKDRPDGDTRRSEMVMTLINKRGAVRERAGGQVHSSAPDNAAQAGGVEEGPGRQLATFLE